MKEFSFSIFDALSQGVRRKLGAIRTNKGATELFNFQLREDGPEPYDPIISVPSVAQMAVEAIVPDYPFPQVFKGNDVFLLVTEDTVYEIDKTTYALTELTLYDVYNPNTEASITADGVWHFADFHSSWYLFNGTSVVFKTNIDATTWMPDRVYVQDDVTIGTGVNFRGRLITSGFNPSNFWNNDWQFAMECLQSNLPDGLSASIDITNNFVWWSMIGGGDTLWRFLPEFAFTTKEDGEFTLEGSKFLDAIERNDMGFMPMPFEGAIYQVKELGGNVIIYGENGIAALKPVSVPVPTFALIEIQNFGVFNRASVGGDIKQHIFIDAVGQVWKLNADLTTQLLDYREFIEPILEDNIGITYYSNTQEFFIGSDSECFMLGPQGLTTVYQLVTSVFYENGRKGVFEELDVTTSLMVSNIITVGNNAQNTITSVEVDGLYDSTVQVAIDYRHNRSDSFTRSRFIDLNKMGWVRFNFAGLEFRVVIQAADYTSFDPSNITVKWKSHDKRNQRGIDVSQAGTR